MLTLLKPQIGRRPPCSKPFPRSVSRQPAKGVCQSTDARATTQTHHDRVYAPKPMKHNPEYHWQNKTFRPAAKGDESDADFLDLQNAFYDAFFSATGRGRANIPPRDNY